jgi:hypothetical protein
VRSGYELLGSATGCCALTTARAVLAAGAPGRPDHVEMLVVFAYGGMSRTLSAFGGDEVQLSAAPLLANELAQSFVARGVPAAERDRVLHLASVLQSWELVDASLILERAAAVPVAQLNDVELATTLLLTRDASTSDATLERLQQCVDELRAAARLTPAVIDGVAVPVPTMQTRHLGGAGNGDTMQSVIWNQAPLSPLLAAVTTANNIAKLLLSAGADVNHCVCGVRAIDRASTPEVIVCLLDVPALDLSKSPFLHSLYGGYVEARRVVAHIQCIGAALAADRRQRACRMIPTEQSSSACWRIGTRVHLLLFARRLLESRSSRRLTSCCNRTNHMLSAMSR